MTSSFPCSDAYLWAISTDVWVRLISTGPSFISEGVTPDHRVHRCASRMRSSLSCLFCYVVGVLRVNDEPPAKIWVVSDNSSLVSNPGIVVLVKLDPKVGVVCLNKFDRDGPSTWGVKVISGVEIVYSVVFKVCVLCDVCWEIVLLSSDDACKLVVECSVLNGRHDGNSSVFQELVGKPNLC